MAFINKKLPQTPRTPLHHTNVMAYNNPYQKGLARISVRGQKAVWGGKHHFLDFLGKICMKTTFSSDA
jgi:hypothetical protein